MPITKRDVEGVESNSILWDQGKGSVPGFGVRRQKDARSFILKYASGGRGRWYTIGKFGAPWTVENARTEAKRLLGVVAGGGDPGQERQTTKQVETPLLVQELCERYMQSARAGLILTRFKRPKKPRTLVDDEGRISRHIVPLIGSVPVKDVDARMVRRLITDISAGKTAADIKTKLRGRAIVKGGLTAAARTADLLSGIMTWAVEEEHANFNFVHGVRRYRAEPRQRFLSDDELKRLGQLLARRSGEAPLKHHEYALAIIELLCLTGCRLGEIANLKWSEVDYQDRCLRLADTKTGRSMRAVGSVVMAKLEQRERLLGSDFVFPAARGSGAYTGTTRQAAAIFSAADLEGVSCHTLRHTYASISSSLGYSDATIAGLLGHAGRGVTSRYVHRPDAALASSAEAVSLHIAAFLGENILEARTACESEIYI